MRPIFNISLQSPIGFSRSARACYPHPMNIRDLLRMETRNEHTAIEAVMPFAQPNFDRRAYRRLLEKFLAFYRPLEERIQAHQELRERGFDYSTRAKTPYLEMDLRALGVDPATVPSAPAEALPVINAYDRLLGCLYVIEGSTLGGQLLKKNLGEKLGLAPHEISFYGSYGAVVGQKWAEFLEFLNSQEVDSAANERALLGARETFRSLRLWLERAE